MSGIDSYVVLACTYTPGHTPHLSELLQEKGVRCGDSQASEAPTPPSFCVHNPRGAEADSIELAPCSFLQNNLRYKTVRRTDSSLPIPFAKTIEVRKCRKELWHFANLCLVRALVRKTLSGKSTSLTTNEERRGILGSSYTVKACSSAVHSSMRRCLQEVRRNLDRCTIVALDGTGRKSAGRNVTGICLSRLLCQVHKNLLRPKDHPPKVGEAVHPLAEFARGPDLQCLKVEINYFAACLGVSACVH